MEGTYDWIYGGYSRCERLVFGDRSWRFTVDNDPINCDSNLLSNIFKFFNFSSMLCHENYPCNAMPADIVANGIIVLAYECGKRHEKQ